MGASDRLMLSGVKKKINLLFFFMFYQRLFIKETIDVKKKKRKKGMQNDYIFG